MNYGGLVKKAKNNPQVQEELAREMITPAHKKAIPNTSPIIANDVNLQYAKGLRAERAGKQLDLAERRLAMDKSNFDERMSLAEDQFDTEKGLGRVAMGVGALDAAVNIGGGLVVQKRADERMALHDTWLKKIADQGDMTTNIFAQMYNLLKLQGDAPTP